jgi:adenylosuccinate lyase
MMVDNIYQSPFSYRYGSKPMREIWSEQQQRLTWRRIWVAVAETMASHDLIGNDQVEDLKSQATNIDLRRARQIEAEIGHDLMSELKTFAEQCPLGGAILHWGLTSADVKDNTDVLCQKAALKLSIARLKGLLLCLAEKIESTADLAVMGYTHLQPAEPTTLGYRLASYAQDLLGHFANLDQIQKGLRGKGFAGAIGTYAPFVEILAGSPITAEILEAEILAKLDLEAYAVKTQTYPRVQDFHLMSALAAMASSVHKFATDLRLLQSPQLSAMAEPFGERQVGSSAMPFKRNPVRAETICSLCRLLPAFAMVAWENAANNWLERTLDDSANRRTIIPQAFLTCDEILLACHEIVSGLVIDHTGIRISLETFAPFSAIERILTALVQAGANRQEMHEHLRQHSLNAWEALQKGEPNPLFDQLTKDGILLKYLSEDQMISLFQIDHYLGIAPQKARALASDIRKQVGPV